jgi:2-polyprenyl-3-methyl-5-hydroxy-6-metoxy-1,4-benzoquinol methylase/predicted nucleotidyltransferase
MTIRDENEARRPGPFPAVPREALATVASDMAAVCPWVEAVYLFGSRARGDARPGSDVDLAVLPGPSGPPGDRLAAEAELARFAEDRLGVPVDVVLIRRDLSPTLLFDIFSVETILHARDPERAHRVACQARAEYRDERPRLDRAFERVRRQIEERANAPTVGIAYDSIAEWYATRVREGGAGEWAFPVLLDLIGDIHSLHLCDLGCGEGRIARLLAQRGARVVGIDLSSELIKVAQREEAAHPLGIHYQVDDAQSLSTIPDATFDAVVCGLALMDVPDLDATFRAVCRVLRPAGWFAFLITHPCFAAPDARVRTQPDGAVSWEIRSYFREGFWRSQESGNLCARVGAYHRTLSTYMNTLVSTGFVVTHMVEPQPPGPVRERTPAYAVVPLLLLVRCAKAHSA